MTQRQPRSQLFPYATLFRSEGGKIEPRRVGRVTPCAPALIAVRRRAERDAPHQPQEYSACSRPHAKNMLDSDRSAAITPLHIGLSAPILFGSTAFSVDEAAY